MINGVGWRFYGPETRRKDLSNVRCNLSSHHLFLPGSSTCSRAFQRFAIRTDAFFNEMKSKGAEKATEHVETAAEKAQEHESFVGDFAKAFFNEVTKGGKKA